MVLLDKQKHRHFLQLDNYFLHRAKNDFKYALDSNKCNYKNYISINDCIKIKEKIIGISLLFE